MKTESKLEQLKAMAKADEYGRAILDGIGCNYSESFCNGFSFSNRKTLRGISEKTAKKLLGS